MLAKHTKEPDQNWFGRSGGYGRLVPERAGSLRRILNTVTLATGLTLGSLGFWSARAQTETKTETYRIGVLATGGATRAIETWRFTQDVLNQASEGQGAPYRFTIIPETAATLENAITEGRIDLLLSDPASFVVAEVRHNARAIMSAARVMQGRSIDQTGALVFTRAESNFRELADLAGSNVMAIAHNDFSGWWLAAQEFRRFRFDPEDHLGEVLFSGSNEREVIYAVQSGLVDAGVIRAGALEELAAQGLITLSDFQPVSARSFDGYPYWVSTPLYPERVLSALPQVPDAALSLVINTLLELEPESTSAQNSSGLAWQAPENYQAVHDLLISLRVPPYENYLYQAMVRIHRHYQWPIYGMVLLITLSLSFLTYQARRNLALAEARRTVLRSETRSKVFYRNAIEEHTVFCMLSQDGQITHVNDRFAEMAGRDKRSLIGQDLNAFLSGRDQSLLAGEILESMKANVPWNGLLRLRKEDNACSWAQSTVIPVTGVDDRLSEMALVATDMTSTQQDVVEETFNDTLELIEDPVVVLRPNPLEVIYCNRAADQNLVKQRVGGDWKDRPIHELITQDDLNMLKMRAEAVVEGPQRRVTWEVDTETGVSYEISLEYVVPDMEEPSFVVMYRDVTERKAAERAKSEFVSTVSHELRTPLTSMKAALKMASSGVVGEVPDKMKDLLNMANRNTERLVTLINDILDLEKIEAEKMVYDLVEMDLVEVINQAVEANSFYAGRFNVTLVPKIDEFDAPFITMGDHNRLMQVMDNLLSNAAKFSREGGEVHINLFRYNGWLRMTIRDFGTGIPEDAQSKIFGKFVQSDSSDTRAKGGTGLGLAIVRPIIAAHRGAISFHSEEDIGTEFFVDLPSLNGEELSTVEPPESLVAAAFSGTELEDQEIFQLPDSVLLQELERRLRRAGWSTELEIGQLNVRQIVSGSGVLGRAIAADLLDDHCINFMSDLVDMEIIQNAPVYVLEASLPEDQNTTDMDIKKRGSGVIGSWLGRVPEFLAANGKTVPERLRVLLIGDVGMEAGAFTSLEIVEVSDRAQAATAIEREDGFDLLLYLRQSTEGCTALMLAAAEGALSQELPLTVFAGRSPRLDASLGVVSKFNRMSGSSRSGRMRKAP